MITKHAFRMASIWLLTMASVVKCCVIVKPMTYWTVFTDRLLNTAISLIWICSIVLTTSWMLGPTDPCLMWWVPQISGHVRAAITTQRLAVTTSHRVPQIQL